MYCQERGAVMLRENVFLDRQKQEQMDGIRAGIFAHK